MSNPDSFIEEVTEEVRRDRLFALFRKYGWIGVVLVLAIVGGASVLAPELELWKLAALNGLAAAFQVIQKLATSFYDDGKLTKEEINAAFNVQTRSKKAALDGE